MTAPLAVLADIGGTNTRVALARGTDLQDGSIRRFRNADHAGIEPVLMAYLAETGAAPEAACVAMAGPVMDGRGTLTNLDWTVDRDRIAAAIGVGTVAVLNDLQAQGHALAHIGPDKLETLMPGKPAAPHAARLVIGVGTGLNAAPVFQHGGVTLVPPAEAGHITLPVQSDDELRLSRFVARAHGTPGIEDVLSGRGIERVYAWLCEENHAAETGTPRDAAAIMAAYEAGNDPLARRTVDIVSRLLGRYAGNLALVLLPFGGVYLIGGVARNFGPYLMQSGFGEAFADKGRFADFMAQFPVHLVTDDYAALLGCAGHLQELIRG